MHRPFGPLLTSIFKQHIIIYFSDIFLFALVYLIINFKFVINFSVSKSLVVSWPVIIIKKLRIFILLQLVYYCWFLVVNKKIILHQFMQYNVAREIVKCVYKNLRSVTRKLVQDLSGNFKGCVFIIVLEAVYLFMNEAK